MSTGVACPRCRARAAAGQRFCGACGAQIAPQPRSRADAPARIGHYRIDREIARGGMGVVYEAYDERLERRVALKVLLGDLVEDPDFRARFILESRAAAALDHPNILPVFDAGEVDGTLYIASRLVDGVDLRSRVERSGSMDVAGALDVAAQIASALDCAHGRGIVHRDVKPANVLLVSDDADGDHAYLIDFGITSSESQDVRLTATGGFVGTPEYMSPEQIGDAPVDGRADQYALACLLWYSLTGAPPFGGQTSVDVLHAHMHTAPPSLTQRRRDIGPALDDAVRRALSKNPARRFETCRAFVSAARMGAQQVVSSPTVLEALPEEVGAPQEPSDGQGRSRRRGALVGATALLLCLIAAGAAFAASRLLDGSTPGAAARARTAKVAATPTATSTPTPTPKPTRAQHHKSPHVVATATPAPQLVDLDPNPPTTTMRLRGYAVDLPDGWTIKRRDAKMPSPDGVVRRETEVSDDATGVWLRIDALTGFDVAAEENRAQLDADYADAKPGYRRIGFSDYDLGGTRGYEWRFRYDDGGSEARRADVLFDRGSRSFGVVAGGEARYDDLAALARRTAESVTVAHAAKSVGSSSESPSSPQPTPPPSDGTYRGIGYQHSATGAVEDDDYRIRMTFGPSEATVRYPDLDCTGHLVADGMRGARRVYDEVLTHGTCDHGGRWTITTVSPYELRAVWTIASNKYVVHAVLRQGTAG